MTEENPAKTRVIRTGVEGLDFILRGGLAAGSLYLLEGDPGAGKTTLALQFLLEGAREGESCLMVTLSESEREMRATAASHGWSLEGIRIAEVIASEDALKPDARYTMFHPSEVELGETIKSVLAETERVKPSRVVFDSLSELRLLAQNPHRYRRQILALKQFFARQNCTAFLVDDKTGGAPDMHLHSLVHGVISLERESPAYGSMRRRLQVSKMRGSDFRTGYHDFAIKKGGIVVFPRLIAAEHEAPFSRDVVASGLKHLDDLLGGGLPRGSSTLLMGPAGTGKSTIAVQYAVAAAARGEHASLFLFDESITTLFERCSALGIDLKQHVDEGRVAIRQIDPAELSPGEFAHDVRHAVEALHSRFVLIDSLNGYLNAMPNEKHLALHLHELLSYLGRRGVVSLLVMAQHGLFGSGIQGPVDTSYLADTVLLLRYFETVGEVRQAISVIKKRAGRHERTIRELQFNHGKGIGVGEPIQEFRGVLTGNPVFVEGFGAAGTGNA
jgi:circadian clock protein KaiC